MGSTRSDSKKKVLFCVSDAGAAHRVAAEGLAEAFELLYESEYDLEIVELFKELDVAPFNTSDVSHQLVSRNRTFESLADAMFNATNIPGIYHLYEGYCLGRLYKAGAEFFADYKPDIVITTHQNTSVLVQALKENALTGQERDFFSVACELELGTVHRMWADPYAEIVTAPTLRAVEKLVQCGVSLENLVFPLYPLRPHLASFRSRAEVLKELGFAGGKASKPVVFITAGGVGAQAIVRIARELVDTNDYQVLIGTGRVEQVFRELSAEFSNNSEVAVLGYVDNMQDYLNAADVVVGKPGSTSVVEFDLFHKKTVITRKIGYNETGNVEYALQSPLTRNIGSNYKKLPSVISELLSLPSDYTADYHHKAGEAVDSTSVPNPDSTLHLPPLELGGGVPRDFSDKLPLIRIPGSRRRFDESLHIVSAITTKYKSASKPSQNNTDIQRWPKNPN